MIAWIKRHFFKITSLILLVVACLSIYIASLYSNIENTVLLPSYSFSDLKSYGFDYVTVSGTLISTSEDGIGNPINTNEFTCDRSTSRCELVQAELSDSNFLSTYSETFNIQSWDDNFIVFSTVADNVRCVIWTYRIDRVKKELIGVRETAVNYDYDSCMGIGLSKFEVKLVDGMKALIKK